MIPQHAAGDRAPEVDPSESADAADTQLLVRLCNRWEQARQTGADVTPTDLCRDRPDLLPDLLRAIEILEVLSASPNDPLVHSPAPVPQIPGYDVLAEIGRGGMGVVYKALQMSLNRIVALKLIWNVDAAAVQLLRFRSEAEATARLQHPNIVQIFETGIADGRPFLAIEYVDGINLKQRVAGVPQPAHETARLLETIARAVHHAHECRIIHRDLKPQNILLTNTGVPKVADFGLARSLDIREGLTLTTDFLGTPAYAAPEQVLNKTGQFGPWTDVYSLGAMLYELLTGHVPFEAESLQRLLQQVAEVEPTPVRRLVASCPRDLQTICLKCLSKEPTRRYQTAAALADDLRRFQASEPIEARPVGVLERTVRWGRRNPAVASLLMVVGVVLVASAIGGGVLSVYLAAALRDARRDRDKATTAEQLSRQSLAASFVATARLARQRGDGRAALRGLDDAIAAGFDPLPLRFERVMALCTLHDIPQAIDEVRRVIQHQPPDGQDAAEALLWQADLEMDAGRLPVEKGLEQVRQALGEGLSPSSRHYAQGLLAKTTPEALGQFRLALEADPTSARAHGMLLTLLIVSGQFPEARDRLLATEIVFPENPIFRVLHAMLDSLTERPEDATRHLQRARPWLSDAAFQAATHFVDYCRKFPALARELEAAQSGDSSAASVAFQAHWRAVITQAHRAHEQYSQELFLPMPPILRAVVFRGLKGINFQMNWFGQFQPDQTVAAIDELVKVHPDGFLWLLQGVLLANKDTQKDWAAAEQAFLRAAETPSIMP